MFVCICDAAQTGHHSNHSPNVNKREEANVTTLHMAMHTPTDTLAIDSNKDYTLCHVPIVCMMCQF